MSTTLAILGGEPVRREPWPGWPRSDERTMAAVREVLDSTRWALSGPSDGRVTFERRFAAAFARFSETAYCTPVSSGTAALTVALQSLGVGRGDEVLVPGLTWVACASAVVHLGAIPVLVDIDPATLTMNPGLARSAVTGRTRAIMVVHLASSVADLDAFTSLSESTGIPLLEDCAQAHGARWRSQRVGTFGQIGCFSMQQSKLLTAGEGGAAITSDASLHDKMEQLRSDGRRMHRADHPGQLELVEVGDTLGRNLCLSELQAAVLLDRLAHLEVENQGRRKLADVLAAALDDVEGVQVVLPDKRVSAPTYYNVTLRFDPGAFLGNSVDAIARALTAELGTGVNPVYVPLNRHRLLHPGGASRSDRTGAELAALRLSAFALPEAEEARRTCATITHPVLLDSEAGMDQIAAAIVKVRDQAGELLSLGQAPSARAF